MIVKNLHDRTGHAHQAEEVEMEKAVRMGTHGLEAVDLVCLLPNSRMVGIAGPGDKQDSAMSAVGKDIAQDPAHAKASVAESSLRFGPREVDCPLMEGIVESVAMVDRTTQPAWVAAYCSQTVVEAGAAFVYLPPALPSSRPALAVRCSPTMLYPSCRLRVALLPRLLPYDVSSSLGVAFTPRLHICTSFHRSGSACAASYHTATPSQALP